MMNTKNMFVFAVAFLLLSLSYTTSTDGLPLRVLAPATSSTVDARQVDVELSTPSVVTATGVPVAPVVQDLSAQDLSAQVPVAQHYVEGVPVEGVPVVHGQKPESRIRSWLRRNYNNLHFCVVVVTFLVGVVLITSMFGVL